MAELDGGRSSMSECILRVCGECRFCNDCSVLPEQLRHGLMKMSCSEMLVCVQGTYLP